MGNENIRVDIRKDERMMELIAMYVVIPTLWFVVALSIYMLIRNRWVYKVRSRILDERFDEYDQFISYNSMMYSMIFTWDVEKMRKGQK